MLEFIKEGNLLDECTDALVNTVNCVGVMGRGVALQFKNRFPENFKAYESACKRGEVIPGKMFITPNGLLPPRWIVNFPTKRHWRNPSRFVDIELGLNDLVDQIRNLRIRSIALPPLGCGLGGLDWSVVRKTIERKMADLQDVLIRVYEPNNAAVHETREQKVPSMTEGRAVLLVLCDRYVHDVSIDAEFTLLALHKLLYFVQADGYALRLKYTRAAAGPYAENLRNVLHHIEGHYIIGYNDGGDSPLKVLKFIQSMVLKAKEFLASVSCHAEITTHIQRVLDLVGPNGDDAFLELLATIHWLFHQESVKGLEDIKTQMWSWGARKRRFSAVQIAFAYNRLKEQGWIG